MGTEAHRRCGWPQGGAEQGSRLSRAQIQEVDTLGAQLCSVRQVLPGSGLSGLWACGHPAALQFSGLWFVVSMVSDCKVFQGKKDHLLMSTRAVTAKAEGNLHVHMEFPG